jgi:dolichol kinase
LGVGLVAALAVWTLLVFLPAGAARPALLGFWAAGVAVGLPAMLGLSACAAVPRILVRKGYHLLALALFLPAYARDAPLLAVALAVALAAMAAAEAARAARFPAAVAAALEAFTRRFTDGRDRGPLLITHFSLLLGMALPLWLAPAVAGGGGAGGGVRATLCGLSGMLIVGLGDTAAAAVGRTLGRARVAAGSGKTWEGAAAGAAATLAGWALALGAAAGSGDGGTADTLGAARWAGLGAATAAACLLEALTDQLDNAVVPLFYLPHVLLAAGL